MRYLNANESEIISGGACNDDSITDEISEQNKGLENIDDIFDAIHDEAYHYTLRK